MTTEQTRKFIEEYAQALASDKSEPTIDKFVTDDHLKGHIVLFEAGIPNYEMKLQDLMVEGNKACLRFLLTGVHNGELFGQPASGRKVEVEGIIIYEVENNKIVNHWMQADTVSLMQQISAVPVES